MFWELTSLCFHPRNYLMEWKLSCLNFYEMDKGGSTFGNNEVGKETILMGIWIIVINKKKPSWKNEIYLPSNDKHEGRDGFDNGNTNNDRKVYD